MVYSATENVKKRLGSCEKVTMKLRSLLNISNISSTCASHKRLEESSQVKDREFSKLYKLGGELGKGGFGVVYAAVRRADKLQVAVKEVYKAKIIKKTADGKIPLEVALMQQVADVPGVIKILDWFESAESFFIVMEKFAGQAKATYLWYELLLFCGLLEILHLTQFPLHRLQPPLDIVLLIIYHIHGLKSMEILDPKENNVSYFISILSAFLSFLGLKITF